MPAVVSSILVLSPERKKRSNVQVYVVKQDG